jgi:hypothetical protein
LGQIPPIPKYILACGKCRDMAGIELRYPFTHVPEKQLEKWLLIIPM